MKNEQIEKWEREKREKLEGKPKKQSQMVKYFINLFEFYCIYFRWTSYSIFSIYNNSLFI